MTRLAADIVIFAPFYCFAQHIGRVVGPLLQKSKAQAQRVSKNHLLCTGNHPMICMHWYSLLFLILDQRFIDIANFKVGLMFFSQKRNGDNDNGRKSNMNLYYLRPPHPPLSREMSTDKWKEIEYTYIPPFFLVQCLSKVVCFCLELFTDVTQEFRRNR